MRVKKIIVQDSDGVLTVTNRASLQKQVDENGREALEGKTFFAMSDGELVQLQVRFDLRVSFNPPSIEHFPGKP